MREKLFFLALVEKHNEQFWKARGLGFQFSWKTTSFLFMQHLKSFGFPYSQLTQTNHVFCHAHMTTTQISTICTLNYETQIPIQHKARERMVSPIPWENV
jgi:hypothetical protein